MGFMWLLFQKQQVRNDFLVIDDTVHWLSISDLCKNIKVTSVP